MSSELFPLNVPGLDIKIDREVLFSTGIQTAQSGKELRAQFQSTPRIKYTIHFNFLRQGAAAGDEAQPLTDFFNARAGAFDTFQFDDPYDGNQYTVRFYGDSLSLSRIFSQIWEGKSIQLITVK